MHADTEATFIQDYKSIAHRLRIGEGLDDEDLLRAVCSEIEALPSWVLVLDNADDLTLFGVGHATSNKCRDLYEFIPKTPGGKVLWTSRVAQIAGTLVGARRAIEVSSMTAAEASRLLATTRNEIDDGEGDWTIHLLEELQYFPLAISQAGAYMQQTSTPGEEYLALLKRGQDRWNVLKESNFDRHRRREISNSVLETLRISIERIRQENMMAYRMLHVIAYLDSQNLSLELMAAICNHSTTPTKEDSETGEVREAVLRLIQFSFIGKYVTQRNTQRYEVHKLVQEATRYALSVFSPLAPDALSSESSNDTNNMLHSDKQYSRIAVQTVSELFPVPNQDTWDECERYLLHAIRVGDWAELCEKQVEVSRLLSRVSRFLHHRRRWREQEPIDQRALYLRREALGEENPETIESLESIAETHLDQGRFDEAEPLHLKILDMRRKILGEKHPDTIKSMEFLVGLYSAQGHFDKAEEISIQVLDLRREVLGDRHPDTIEGMVSVASRCHQQGHFEEAMKRMVQALDLQREVIGERHPDTIETMDCLARLHRARGHHDENKKISTRVLDLSREVLGEKHPDTIESMETLATAYLDQGHVSEAQEMTVQTLDLRREVLGENHPTTIQNMANLAAIYQRQERYSEAESLFSKAIDLQERLFGEKHPAVLRVMVDLAVTYHDQGRYEDAESLITKALNAQREILGEHHPDTVNSMANLAAMYLTRKQYKQAESLYQKTLDFQREALGEQHPDTIKSMKYLSRIRRWRPQSVKLAFKRKFRLREMD